jgi:hypothetical protein
MTSSINPQNIDGNYPVAGVPNNTQGFRDNFTNIQTNFTYAKNEITDLENKAILKSALSGSTLDNNMADQLIYSALIRDFSGSLVQNTVTSGSVTLDYSAGHYQTVSTTGSITLGFTNFPTAGTVGMMRVQVNITNTAYTMTLPAAVTLGITGIQGISANVITFAATGYYEFGFVTSDGGTTITVFDLNRPLSYYTNTVNVAATTSSTSTTTGALIVAGGMGIAGNLYVGGDIFGNVTVTDISLGNVSASGFVSATGNVTGGNISTAGLISATGTISAGGVVLTGNISANGYQGNTFSVTGNVTGANIIGIVAAGSNTITTLGNISGGNILTGGLISATANVTGGNIRTNGQVSATGNALFLSGTAVPAGGTAGAGIMMSSTTNLGVFFGSGAPTIAAAQGSLYLRTDGSSASNRLYVNTTGSTSWTSVTTAI